MIKKAPGGAFFYSTIFDSLPAKSLTITGAKNTCWGA